MRTRLQTDHPDLGDAVLRASPIVARVVAGLSAKLVMDMTGLDRAFIEAALTALSGRGALPMEMMEKLQDLQEEADTSYLGVLEALDADQALPPDADAQFRRARALTALLFALETSDGLEASEAIYEALAASHDELSVVTICGQVLAATRGDQTA